MSETINIEQSQNDIIDKWASMVTQKLRTNASGFVLGKSKPRDLKGGGKELKLADSIRYKTGTRYGVIDRVSFSFERHGVFVQKGVGRGQGIKHGFIITSSDQVDSNTVDKHTQRHPQDWFNSEIDKNLPELADKLQEISADLLLNAARLMIK